MPTITHRDASLYYELQENGGERILLIQGVGLIGNGWKPQVEGLEKRHSLLTFDNRGIGLSYLRRRAPFSIEQMADDADALTQALGWARYHVAGHSMGGVIAQRLALTNPSRIKSLALVCTVSRGADAVRMTPRILWTFLRTAIGPEAKRRKAFLGLIFPREFLLKQNAAALANEVAPLFGHDLASQPSIARRQVLALRSHDCTRELNQLERIPALVISAEHDPIAPPHFGRELASRIPGARFVEIPDASHGASIQHASKINELMEEFIRNAA
jgi:pimeloyl-ACP methyl ester carboxylesterase